MDANEAGGEGEEMVEEIEPLLLDDALQQLKPQPPFALSASMLKRWTAHRRGTGVVDEGPMRGIDATADVLSGSDRHAGKRPVRGMAKGVGAAAVAGGSSSVIIGKEERLSRQAARLQRFHTRESAISRVRKL